MHRRRFLYQTSASTASIVCATMRTPRAWAFRPAEPAGVVIETPIAGEDAIAYVHRQRGTWDESLYKQLLGAANDFKEGDAIVGVAAADDRSRQFARQLIGNTPLTQIDRFAPHQDQLARTIDPANPSHNNRPTGDTAIDRMTVMQFKEWLIASEEAEIHRIKDRLSSDVIAGVVKLMTNQELIAISSKLYNPLPNSPIGSRGYLSARVQPNSPTDNVDDIRWQVFDAMAYAVGDLLLGTNPVSSNPRDVLAVERTLKDILTTFGIENLMPHCVLSHIDIQAEVEEKNPGSTALWFQSIAGNDAANKTFDVSVDKLIDYARRRTGPFGLYFETGQGADFTNGHADGCDMVLWESRKYGLARSLTGEIARLRGQPAWVHVNDVAGFIGPEVFRTREQLVRCCLEDLVMGKLHGLTIGLDVCSTLHMDVTLSDLDWCLDQVAPAGPAYLMALPTKIDPMLGYLTTGYQDHVRLREKFGLRVSDAMWQFFQQLQVIDASGRPTEHFGDPVWVYQQYCRRKGDERSGQEIVREAEQRLSEVRGRGVFLARGFGDAPSQLAPALATEVARITDDARQCIWQGWRDEFVLTIPHAHRVGTQSRDRQDYVWHPETGERLSSDAISALQSLAARQAGRYTAQIVISEGLNALALMDPGNLMPLLEAVRRQAESAGVALAPEQVVLTNGRVRAGYRAGETLFAGLAGPRTVLHIIGERPGSGHHTMSVYVTRADGAEWTQAGSVDHNITRVVSGIATTALSPEAAGKEVGRLLAS